MVLTKQQLSRIEWHFFHLADDYDALEQCRLEVAEASRPLDPTGCHGSTPGDPTGAAVVTLEARTATLEGWIQVVTDTYTRYHGRPEGILMQCLYVQRLSVRRAAKAMHVSAATAYNWRLDVLTYAALKGVERGLVKV